MDLEGALLNSLPKSGGHGSSGPPVPTSLLRNPNNPVKSTVIYADHSTKIEYTVILPTPAGWNILAPWQCGGA